MDEQLTQSDLSWLEKFKAEALRFRDAYNALVSKQAFASERPELRAEYDALYSRGAVIKGTIDSLTQAVDRVTGFFSGATSAVKRFFGLDGVPVMPALSGRLGVVPLIPIAMIASAVALMGKWVADVYLFERKVTEQQRLESDGVPAVEAAAIVRGMSAGSGFSGVLDTLKTPILIGGGLLFFIKFVLPEILKDRKG